MKKLLFGLVVLLGFGIASQSEAASARGAKKKTVINFSATAVEACKGPCTVYSVWIASGTDFAILRDSGTANTTSNPSAYALGVATGLTQVTLDPPLMFNNGVSLNCAATTNFCGVTTQVGNDINQY